MRHTPIYREQVMHFTPGQRVWFEQVMSSTSGIVRKMHKHHAIVKMDNGIDMKFPVKDLRGQP